MAAGVRLAQLGRVERADPLEQLELVAEMRAHHLRAVGRDRERDAVVDEGAEASRESPASSASAFVRRFEVGQISSTISASRSRRHQRRVVGGQNAVADPVGAKALDDLTDLLGARRALLADVDRDAESGGTRRLDHRAAPTV